jgi:hypothetical protein
MMIAAGVFAFAAFAVLSAYAPELRRGNDGGQHALSRSAVGFAGAVGLLERMGTPVEVQRGGRGQPAEGLLVLTPTLRVGAGKVADLARGQGPAVLVVLPKWSVTPDPRRPGWVVRQATLFPPAINGWVGRWLNDPEFSGVRQTAGTRAVSLATGVPGAALTPAGRIDQLQVILPGPRIAPMLSAPEGVVLGRVLPQTTGRDVYVLSDPDLLNTHGLAQLDTAQAGLAILDDVRPGGGPVAFDLSLHGFSGGRSLLKLAFAPPFLAVTLCAAAAAALAGWQAAVRFGPNARARPAFALGKQALADNAAALIKLSGREPRMARRYAELVQARAARAVAAPQGDEEATAAYLDALPRASADAPRLFDLQAQARGAGTREQLLAVARRLHQWRREIAREQ